MLRDLEKLARDVRGAPIDGKCIDGVCYGTQDTEGATPLTCPSFNKIIACGRKVFVPFSNSFTWFVDFRKRTRDLWFCLTGVEPNPGPKKPIPEKGIPKEGEAFRESKPLYETDCQLIFIAFAKHL